MPDPSRSDAARRRSAQRRRKIASQYTADVETYVAAGGDVQVQRIITAINRLAKQLSRWYDAQLNEVGLTPPEWDVLGRLATAGDTPLTPGQLADLNDVAPSSMTHRLDRLVDKDLVARGTDPDNRSRVQITLTRAGWEKFSEAVRVTDIVESEVLARVDVDRREELADLLDLVMAGLDDLATE